MNENYIVINGKKIELTDEQVKALLVTVRKNPFEIVERGEDYFYVNRYGDINNSVQGDDSEDDCLFQAANYFNDESFAQQVALHQLLYRELLKFAYDNECEDTKEWNENNRHFGIMYDGNRNKYDTWWNVSYKQFGVYFSSEEDAERAIHEVVEPFMKEHPDFIW